MFPRNSIRLPLAALLALSLRCALAESPESVAAFIDRELEAAWAKAQLTPSSPCTDAEFLRRVYLDIGGVIPAAAAIKKFLESPKPSRRKAVVEGLLASDAYSQNASVFWANLMVGRGEGLKALQQIPFRNWLRDSFAQNLGMDAITRAVLTATGPPEENPAVVWTLHHRGTAEDLAGAATRLFLGMQVQCAQCHNHPFEKWKQADFYGMAAFFSRVKVDQKLLKFNVRELPSGEIRLGGASEGPVVAPRFLTGESPPAAAKESRRKQLADWLVSPQNQQFAKAIVNRTWAQFFGRGLVHPVDDFGEGNPPAHPAILERLALGFASSGYDMADLVRAITATRAYQLSTRPSSNNANDAENFSRAHLRPLGPEQLLASVVQSTGLGSHKELVESPVFKLMMAAVLRQFIFVFANMDESTEVNEFQGTVSQALLLMNSQAMQKVVDFKPMSPLNAVLRRLPDEKAQVEWLYLSTLSRQPTSEEARQFAELIRRGGKRQRERIEVCEDLYWALLNSAEFAMNH